MGTSGGLDYRARRIRLYIGEINRALEGCARFKPNMTNGKSSNPALPKNETEQN